MVSVTLTVSDADAQRVLNAFNYTAQQGSAMVFIKAKLTGILSDIVFQYEREHQIYGITIT